MDLVSLEVAELAKEKGFDWICRYYYETTLEPITIQQMNCHNKEGFKQPCIPYQSQLQKWLREIHDINVESNYLPNINNYRYLAKPMGIKGKDFKTVSDYYKGVNKYYGKKNYNTYEEALEEGLKEALKLI